MKALISLGLKIAIIGANVHVINQQFVADMRSSRSDFDIAREVIEKSDYVRKALVCNQNFFIYEGNNPNLKIDIMDRTFTMSLLRRFNK
jgi:hypothetical protein